MSPGTFNLIAVVVVLAVAGVVVWLLGWFLALILLMVVGGIWAGRDLSDAGKAARAKKRGP